MTPVATGGSHQADSQLVDCRTTEPAEMLWPLGGPPSRAGR